MQKINLKKIFISIILALTIFASVPFAIYADETENETAANTVAYEDGILTLNTWTQVDNTYITKYGNVYLNVKKEDFLSYGFSYGDILTVDIAGNNIDVPFCNNYTDVDYGAIGIFARSQDSYVNIGINSGNFAGYIGIANKVTNEDSSYEWQANSGFEGTISVTVKMKQEKGYFDEINSRYLERSDSRESYPDLKDEEYANFREVTTTGMGEGILYRTSTPISDVAGRNTQAMAAIESAGVDTIMNLADDADSVSSYDGFADSYYAKCKYVTLNMSTDFTAESFREKLLTGLTFFADNPGTYALHCSLGKDRAGHVAALLELFMGASEDEIIKDYMTSYYNLYDVKEDDSIYEVLVQNFKKSMSSLLKAGLGEDYSSENLLSKQAVTDYFKAIGMTDEQIGNLRVNLNPEAAASEETTKTPETTEVTDTSTQTADQTSSDNKQSGSTSGSGSSVNSGSSSVSPSSQNQNGNAKSPNTAFSDDESQKTILIVLVVCVGLAAAVMLLILFGKIHKRR